MTNIDLSLKVSSRTSMYAAVLLPSNPIIHTRWIPFQEDK